MQSYRGHCSIFLVQIFKVNPQVYFTYNHVTRFSVLVFKNMLAGKSRDSEGEYQNLSAKFFTCLTKNLH